MIPSHSCEKDKTSKNQGIVVTVTDGQSSIATENSQDLKCQCLLIYGFLQYKNTGKVLK